jgi:hypothetical protein
MADDFNSNAAMHRGRQLVAARKQAEAHLAQAEAYGDVELAAEKIQELANIDREGRDLNDLHNSYVQHRNPPPQAPQTEGEFMSKAPERMDYNDTLRIVSKSRYGQVTPEELKRGISELQRRKSLGQYKD